MSASHVIDGAGDGETSALAVVPIAELEDEITTLSAHIGAAEHRLLRAIGEFDARGGWVGLGIASCAHWLNWKCSLSLPAAHEKVRVARALRQLPQLSAAMSRGAVSYSKVRALTRVATAENEAALVRLAQQGTASHIEEIVRRYRRVCRVDDAAHAAKVQRSRELRYRWDDDGTLILHARLPPEQGAQVLKALEAATDALRESARPAPAPNPQSSSHGAIENGAARAGSTHGTAPNPGPEASAEEPGPLPVSAAESSAKAPGSMQISEPQSSAEDSCPLKLDLPEASAAAGHGRGSGDGRGAASESSAEESVHALVRAPESSAADRAAARNAAESASRVGSCACSAAESFAARRADALVLMAESVLAHGVAGRAASERHQVVVHVEAAALAADRADGRSELERGPALCLETVRRLLCDGSVVPLLEAADGTPLDVGRKTRAIPTPLRRALGARDRGCRFPGCSHKRFTDAHHIHHWSDGGETNLLNLVSLCRVHHRLVHEEGFTIERDGKRLVFRTPAGQRVEEAPPQRVLAHDPVLALMTAQRDRGITARTCVPEWMGEVPAYDWITDSLWRRDHRGADDPKRAS